jgi:hypothetical protein
MAGPTCRSVDAVEPRLVGSTDPATIRPEQETPVHRQLLDVTIWVLFLGGLFGLGASLVFFFTGHDVVEYATLGIGGGFWLLAATVAILVAHRIGSTNG